MTPRTISDIIFDHLSTITVHLDKEGRVECVARRYASGCRVIAEKNSAAWIYAEQIAEGHPYEVAENTPWIYHSTFLGTSLGP